MRRIDNMNQQECYPPIGWNFPVKSIHINLIIIIK